MKANNDSDKANIMAPLTESQMGVYLEQIHYPDSVAYNIPVSIDIDKPDVFDAGIFYEAVTEVIDAHPALLSHIEEHDGTIYMVKTPGLSGSDLCRFHEGIYSDEEAEKCLKEITDASLVPFDLYNGPLCSMDVYFSDKKIYIFLNLYHINSDGTSLSLLIRQIADAVLGRKPEAETTDAFCLYDLEKSYREDGSFDRSEKYFEQLLSGVDVDSNIIPDYDQSKQKIKTGYSTKRKCYALKGLSHEMVEKIRELKKITASTLFMGAYGYALAKMTGQKESIICAAESGRKNSNVKNTVSMMVRTLPVYVSIDETVKPLQMLEKLQAQFFASLKNDYCSFGKLAEAYGIKKDIAFAYQGSMLSGFMTDAGLVRVHMCDTGQFPSNISVNVFKREDGFELMIYYRDNVYKESTIDRMVYIFEQAALCFVQDKDMRNISLTSENDLRQLDMFNEKYSEMDVSYNENETFPDMFSEAVKRHSEHMAVMYKDRHYSYAELDKISDGIAQYIHKLGIGRGQAVSILAGRSDCVPVAAVGILKSGAAYQPLDPQYPPERLSFMQQDADTRLVIADRNLMGLLPDYKGNILYTDEIFDLPEISEAVKSEVEKYRPSPKDLFVLLYTSGTTGNPKGCMITHANIRALINAHIITTGINENSKDAAYASFGFDAHLVDFYPTLAIGGTLYIIPDEMRLNLEEIKDFIEENGITHMTMTTQVARQFATEYKHVKHLECLFTGGENLGTVSPADYRFLNLYGPTECTVYITGFEVDKEYANTPIGTAVPGTRLYITDSYQRRVPVGVPGELLISGPQVAKGYLNREDKTNEVFIPAIVPDSSGKYNRCYKTGDIVRYLESGDIEFIGRRDMQVKIRGFRIELGEIEQVIRTYPGIKDAVCIACDIDGGKCIHAYITADSQIDINELNSFIRKSKPAYMVPQATMQIDSIPLTPNQKVDKKKLPPIKKTPAQAAQEGKKSLTKLEKELCSLICKETDIQELGVDEDLAFAGVTSISSIKLAVKLYKKYGVSITSTDILDGGTVLSLENTIVDGLISNNAQNNDIQSADAAESENIKAGSGTGVAEAGNIKAGFKKGTAELRDKYPLTQTQTGIYLDCLRAGMGAYNIPVLLRLPSGINMERLKQAIIKAVMAHPSMLVYIYADEKGDVNAYPVNPEAAESIVVKEEEINALPPEPADFEFGKRFLFSFRIITCKNEKYLFVEMHHIIADGASMSIFMEDVRKACDGMPLKTESYTAFEAALEEENRRKGKELVQAEAYYDSVFSGLSADYLPYADRQGEDSCIMSEYGVDVPVPDIKAFVKKMHVSENVIFTGIFAVLIAKYTAHEDALFATVHNGRTDPRTENLISMLVKTFPVYANIDAEMKIKDYFNSLDKSLKDLKKHDIFSFADAAKKYGLNADVIFVFQGKTMAQMSIQGQKLEQVIIANRAAKACISFEVIEDEDSYRIEIEYNGGKYSSEFIETLAESYTACLKSFMSKELLGDIEIISQKEFHKFDKFNDTFVEVPYRPACRLIEEFAQKHPDRLAVVANNEKLTYRQLDFSGNALANVLLGLNVKKGCPVAIILGRIKEVYVCQLGIMKAGCAFLCLSPEYPDDRISFVCEDGGIGAVITTRQFAEQRSGLFSGLGLPVVFIEDIRLFDAENIGCTGEASDGSCPDKNTNVQDACSLSDTENHICAADGKAGEKGIYRLSYENPGIYSEPDELSYVIYTSGSTGKPKGVMLTQKGLLNIATNDPVNIMVHEFFPEGTVSTAVSAFTFDASVVEGFIALANGSTVCIANDEEIHNPVAFRKLCMDNNVTSVLGTPSFLLSLIDLPAFADVVKRLHAILAGGEVFSQVLYDKLRKLNPELKIINGYGPSECTISTSNKLLDGSDITIGTPTINSKTYITDKQLHILPMGALGEMVVAGISTGRGYINRDELNKRSFITFMGEPAFRTGDLALVTHSGEIEFHGRLDNQVKIRGLRVELGEIENAINACEGINTCIVTVNGDEKSRFLAAYYTASKQISPKEIKEQISRTLANYMVPQVMIQLEVMPLTANGKIDKKALPKPEFQFEKAEYIPPRNETERIICDVMAQALGLEKVGIDDDFFALGGTSLTATKLAMSALTYNISIVYADVFKYPTARQLAGLAQGSEPENMPKAADASGAASGISPDETNASGAASGISPDGNNASDALSGISPDEKRAANKDAAEGISNEGEKGRDGLKAVPGQGSLPDIPTGFNADTALVNSALSSNVWHIGDSAGCRPLGNVMLTGVTGFLGIHVLYHFLKYETGKIYCLMRKGASASLESKLLGMYIYYFDESIEDELGKRIICLEGDITDDSIADSFKDLPVDTLINCAACVKHFAHGDILQQVNVHGVENLIKLCKASGIRLIHVSTVSVAGEGMDGIPPMEHLMHENELYFGQMLENDYIISKFKAECLVLEAISNGLDAKIMRAGNLMPRLSDGEIQINYRTNGFMRRLHGYVTLGSIPYSVLSEELEFSPIDETAAAIICLAKSDSRFTVFHASNTHRVYMADVLRAMNFAGIEVKAVDEDEFTVNLNTVLADPEINNAVSGLIAYLNRNTKGFRYMMGYDNYFTRSVLNRMGFMWHITDDEYMKQAFIQISELGFFDLDSLGPEA